MKPAGEFQVYEGGVSMNCAECRKQIEEWLVEALEVEAPVKEAAPELPREARAHAAGCMGCGRILQAALQTARGGALAVEPPRYLASKVRARLQEARWVRPRLLRVLGPAAIAAVAAIALGLWLAPALRPLPPSAVDRQGERAEVIVEFRLVAPTATVVAVVGDWNGWDPQADHLADSDGDGVWEARVRLVPSREYRYQFQIDGQTWMPDPQAPLTIDDGFGGKTSVLQL
jgi:hypothetical protein